MCTAAGEWEGRTDYTDCIAAGQQEMVCITEMDASDISLYIYLVGEEIQTLLLQSFLSSCTFMMKTRNLWSSLLFRVQSVFI